VKHRTGGFTKVGAAPKFLRSLRLTVPLLFALATLSVAGSLAGPQVEKAVSPVFLGVVGMLAANISFCTWHRFRIRPRSAAGGRRAVPWLDAAVHFSLVVLIAGGAGKGIWGTVGTGYLFPGTPATTMYLEDPNTDAPLGFTVLLEEKREAYYPLRLKVGVRGAATGEKVALLEVVEGRATSLPDGRLTLSVREVLQNPAAAVMLVRTAGGETAVALPLVAGGDPVTTGPFRLTAVAWRRDIRDVRGRVKILEGERVVQEGWLEVNGALAHRGTSLFLTSWGADEFGNEFLGVQYRSDPTAPVFWAGAIIFALALPPFVLLRRRRVPREPPRPASLP